MQPVGSQTMPVDVRRDRLCRIRNFSGTAKKQEVAVSIASLATDFARVCRA